MRFFQWVLSGFTFIGLLYVIAINAQITGFHWSHAQDAVDLPLYIVILVTFACGYILGLLYYWLGVLPSRLRQNKIKRDLEDKIAELEDELERHMSDYDE